ncbi:MAG: hypothetical protein IPH22_12690 [Nitrosomonas sp.]|nr:hypothetical protein [Nitrosomonas sp.]
MHRTVPIVRLDDILDSERGLTQEEGLPRTLRRQPEQGTAAHPVREIRR